jgi:hypothetical protein
MRRLGSDASFRPRENNHKTTRQSLYTITDFETSNEPQTRDEPNQQLMNQLTGGKSYGKRFWV